MVQPEEYGMEEDDGRGNKQTRNRIILKCHGI
jgi:hypothetical protein